MSQQVIGVMPSTTKPRRQTHDWEQHLAGIFPEIRLKSFLELRSADAGCGQMVVALNALWTGLLYDQESLALADELTQDWSSTSWQQLATTAATHGLSGVSDYGSLKELAAAVLSLAEDGLNAVRIERSRTRRATLPCTAAHARALGRSAKQNCCSSVLVKTQRQLQLTAKDLWEFPW